MKQELEAVALTVMLLTAGCVQKTPPLKSTVTNGQDDSAGEVTPESVILDPSITAHDARWVGRWRSPGRA